MITLDLARKLKEAGLEIKCWDCELFWIPDIEEAMYVTGDKPSDEYIWLPRLDQLLKEIMNFGYGYRIGTIPYITDRQRYYCIVFKSDWGAETCNRHEESTFTSQEDAVAKALLRIISSVKSD